MQFKKWLENSNNALSPARSEDPELNGLSRGVAYVRPNFKKATTAGKRINRLYGKHIEEAVKEHSYGACSFFTDGEKVLLLKRSCDATAPGKWGLVCGHSQHDESPLTTAKRESKEEIGKFSGKRFGSLLDDSRFPVFFFRVESLFDCKLDEENIDWKWVNFNDLSKYDLHPLLRKSIGRFVAYVRREH